MKNIALLAFSLILVNCGTVVGNGRSSAPDKKTVATNDNANTGSPTSSAGSGDNPTAYPESAEIIPLLNYFLVPCASPFATSNDGSYSSASAGAITVAASGDIRTLSGAITASITLDPSTSSPYAIEELSQAPDVTCESKVETPLSGGAARVLVTFSDDVSIEWTFDSDNLLSFKALSADGNVTIEYQLND